MRPSVIVTLIVGGVALVGGFALTLADPRPHSNAIYGAMIASGCVGAAIGGHRAGRMEYLWGFLLGMFFTAGGWIAIAWLTRPRTPSEPPVP